MSFFEDQHNAHNAMKVAFQLVAQEMERNINHMPILGNAGYNQANLALPFAKGSLAANQRVCEYMKRAITENMEPLMLRALEHSALDLHEDRAEEVEAAMAVIQNVPTIEDQL